MPPLWINRKRKTDSVPSLKLTAGLPLKLENQICWKITFPFAAKGLFSAVNRQSYFWKFCGTSREPTNDELIKRNHNMNFFWDSKSAKKMQKKHSSSPSLLFSQGFTWNQPTKTHGSCFFEVSQRFQVLTWNKSPWESCPCQFLFENDGHHVAKFLIGFFPAIKVTKR